jgi:uncharacterized repeat protein (TIGR01451 family)
VLSIAKVANPVGPVNAGQNIGFDVTVTNNGPGTAFNVTINDPLPGGTGISWSTSTSGCSISGSAPTQSLACTINSLAALATFTASVTSGTTSESCGTITNTSATAVATNAAQVTSNSASVTVNCANVSISKTAVSSPVNAGSNIAFDITVTNTGAGAATNVVFNDPLPTVPAGLSWSIVSDPGNYCSITTGTLNCTVPTLAALTGSYTVRVQSATTLATCGLVSNQANLTSPRSQLATASLTINCPNVSILKTAVSGTVNAGDNVQFDIVASNAGAGTASGVGFTDVLPSFGGTWSIVSQDASNCSISSNTLTCSGITLAALTGSYTVRVQSTTNGSVCTTVENTASLTSPFSGSSKASVTVACPNLTLGKTADAASVDAGSQIGFTVTLGNTGTGTATTVAVNDPLPAGSGISWSLSPASTGWSITGAVGSQVLSYSAATLAAGASSSAHVISGTTAASCRKYDNTASATVANGTNPGDASASTTVNCLATLTVTKTIVGGGSQLFDFTQTTPTNTSYSLTNAGSKVTSNLVPGSYTVCEVFLAVSWSATATVDGASATLTNPNASDVPAQDLGTRCVSVTLAYGDSKTVAWTNKPPPGGDARTIGYWKNWSSCTGGNQYTKAQTRGLLNKTLDGNLPQTIGLLTLATCPPALLILDKSDLSGKKLASDPAFNLAAQLLAAQLNYTAGAKQCAAATANIANAQTLLAGVKFNGTGTYAKALGSAGSAQANALATKLDQYNNNNPAGCI